VIHEISGLEYERNFPMDLDLDDGLFIFEVTLGYKVDEIEHMTVPFVLKADDADDAEEIVQDFLEMNQLANSFWLVESTGPFEPEEYQKQVKEAERERWDRLEDHSEEDFLEILHSEDL